MVLSTGVYFHGVCDLGSRSESEQIPGCPDTHCKFCKIYTRRDVKSTQQVFVGSLWDSLVNLPSVCCSPKHSEHKIHYDVSTVSLKGQTTRQSAFYKYDISFSENMAKATIGPSGEVSCWLHFTTPPLDAAKVSTLLL